MFDIGLQEMLVIGVIALLVFGPSKLPELGRMVGRAMREFRRASDEFRATVETNLNINEPDPPPPLPVTAEPIPDTTEPYAAQRGGRLFHRRECRWTSRIAETDRVYFKQISDARDQGFAECP